LKRWAEKYNHLNLQKKVWLPGPYKTLNKK